MAVATANGRATRAAKPKHRVDGPRVYSYIRFSTPEQALGDSERRQLEIAKRYADKVGLPFDQILRLTDLGRSAFHGHHRTKGALGEFLDSVRRDEVAPGSILVIEDIDRLSRQEPIEHLEMIFDLVKREIRIHTPTDDTTYSRESINSGLLYRLTTKIELAHEESLKKSRRLAEVWNEKRKSARETGKLVTKIQFHAGDNSRKQNHRRWLILDQDGNLDVLPAGRKTLVMMFKLKLRSKGCGPEYIAKQLNAKAPWKPPGGWIRSYIQKLLYDRSLIGEYQPHRKVAGKRVPDGEPIPDYFPNVFVKHPGLFEAVQQKRVLSPGKTAGGRSDKAQNLFVKLVKCAYCGGPMHFTHKSEGLTYLYCDKAKTGRGCDSPNIRYDECEKVILENCRRLQPEQVLPRKDDEAKLCRSLRQRIQSRLGVIAETERKIDSVNEQILIPAPTERRKKYDEWITKFEAELVEENKQLNVDQRKLKLAEQSLEDFTDWQANLKSLWKALGDGKPELRQRLNAHLRDFIDRIEIFARGHKNEYDDLGGVLDGDEFRDYFYATQDEAFPNGRKTSKAERQRDAEFIRWAIAQRMTKRGRFIRIHFKTAGDQPKFIDVEPEKSIAGQPGIDPLYVEFQAKTQKKQ